MNQNIRLIARVDANGIIQYVNNEYLEWLGYSADELIGQPSKMLRSPNAVDQIQSTIHKQCLKNRPVNFPVCEKKSNGETYWADMRIQPTFENGQYIGYTSVKRLMTSPDKIRRAEDLYQKIASGKLVFFSGEWVGKTKHKINALFGLHRASLNQKIIAITASIAIVILGIAFAYQQYEKQQIETSTAVSHSENFAAILDSLMIKKSELGITNAIGITNATEVQNALANNDQQGLNIALGEISAKYRAMTEFKSIKLHFTDENQQSFYKSWKPLNKQKISDLSNRGYLKKLASEQKPMVVYAVSSAGFNIKSILPMYRNGTYEGGVELIQGMGSIRNDFANNDRAYLLAVSKEYIMAGDKFRKMNATNIPVSNDGNWVVGNDKQFSMAFSGKQIEALRQIDLTRLFNSGFLTTDTHFHYAKAIHDSSNNLIGYHVISVDITSYQAMLAEQFAVAEHAFMELLIALTILIVLILSLLWVMVIKPIRQTQITMEKSVKNSDLFARVHSYGNDEIAQMAKAYNRQSMLAQVVNAEVSSAMEEILAGRLSYEIQFPFQSDYGILKNRINETSRSLNTTFATIEEVMNDLQNGDFSKEHTNNLKGAYAQVVDDCLASMHSLSAAFREINSVMNYAARGKFDERIQNLSAGDIRTLQETLNQTLSHIEIGFSDIVKASQRIAQGDLTQPITHQYEFTMDEAKQAINESINSLTTTLSQVTKIAYQVRSDVSSVAEGAQNLNQRTQEQAAALEETSAAMEETNSQIQNNLNNTKMASEIAQSQNGILTDANGVMKDTKTSMNNIQTASNKIREITGLIDSIAFQTNLLALNAAVEAARAGEHGRGFAVVAGEVRNLAGKSADAAKEISTLIEQTSNAINIGVDQVGKVGSSLDHITDETQKMLTIVNEVSTASVEQSQGVDEINKAITSLDSTTQQNAALVEETTATAETLLDSSEQLQNSVSSFQLQRKLN
ncbi:MAG: methyl-accepting chemotaxis protein [Pseudomonadota bacterium]|nr:methyl-accepting chemotaxis protein [Pseudomonadota bacterium]